MRQKLYAGIGLTCVTNDMAMDTKLENHNIQAIGATIMFSAVIIFGFVFWKIFASENNHLIETKDGARVEIPMQGGEAVTRFP